MRCRISTASVTVYIRRRGFAISMLVTCVWNSYVSYCVVFSIVIVITSIVNITTPTITPFGISTIFYAISITISSSSSKLTS